MSETLLEQIEKVRASLQSATESDFASGQKAGLLAQGDTGLPLDARLQAFNLALMQNLVDNVHNNHDQIALTYVFARHMTFFGKDVTPDLSFWTTERNDDVELDKLLFLRAQNGVETIVQTLPNEQALPFAARQKQLLDSFNMHNQRMVDGLTLYDASENPGNIAPGSKEEQFKIIRNEQLGLALKDVENLIQRSILCLQRSHFVTADIKPLFALSADPATASWDNEVQVNLKNGLESLDQAETILRFHVARYSVFPSRLENAKIA
jgi:hypothetical protein